jgi:hypothetical protein
MPIFRATNKFPHGFLLDTLCSQVYIMEKQTHQIVPCWLITIHERSNDSNTKRQVLSPVSSHISACNKKWALQMNGPTFPKKRTTIRQFRIVQRLARVFSSITISANYSFKMWLSCIWIITTFARFQVVCLQD